MKFLPIALFACLFTAPAVAAPPQTMRVDYYHTGNAYGERIMFTRDQVPFCAVCRRTIETIRDPYSR
ncbi:MAG TPA: hypothetical protein VHU82_12705 [Vicinamibacterales bacterium]|nr:hypothetical protein [Vicinamibacterales bacterium]